MKKLNHMPLFNLNNNNLICNKVAFESFTINCDFYIVELAQVDNAKHMHVADIKMGFSAVLPGIDSCIGIIIKTDSGSTIASHVGIYDCGVDESFDVDKFDDNVYSNPESENMVMSMALIIDDLKNLVGENKISNIMIIGQDAGSEWPYEQLNDFAKLLDFSGELMIFGCKEGVNTACSVVIDRGGCIYILNNDGRVIHIKNGA